MQPPPRKVKPNVALKNTHADQVSKLQIKHQQECDLLEDIRTFFSRKAVLEKEYAQGLQKITSQLLKRDFPAQPDLSSDDGQEHKTVTAVWRSILVESDQLAKARLQASEVYAEKAAEALKPVKAAKMQCFKKVMPQLAVIQTEVAQCVMELVKTQKLYQTEGSLANDARVKVCEAEDKLKRKSTGIFQSLSGLQKTCTKLRTRTEASEVKETAARNEYLLTLAAANAHHIRYYSTDLPDVMKTMDCDIYEKIQESLTVAGHTAADLAEAESKSFKTIATEAAKICREFSLQCYLFQNPVFTNLVQYQFEPCQGDMCNKISSDHNAGPDLEKEARKWATKVAKETRAIRDYYRQITVLQNAKSGDKTSDTGSQESTTVDPEVKLEEVKVNLRKAETAKLKAEARLEALRLGGVNVEEWMTQAQMESLAAEESGLARTPSQASLRTESSGGQSGTDEQDQTYTHYDDDDDFIDEAFNASSGSRSGRVYPIYCKALYEFVASNYDEMTIKAEEDLELIADGDGEGWVKAKNSLGQEGYIPETYVDLGGLSTAPAPLGVEALNAINDTLNDMTSGQQEQREVPDLQSPDLQQDTTSSYSSGDLEVQQTTEVMVTDKQPVPMTVVTNSEVSWARALYDYEAQTDEELSFLEGALIRVVRKDDNGVDDGFWEGECNGRRGVFPSLVVEEISGPTLDPLSPPLMPIAPDFSIPPPVQITLPTPDAEPPPPPVLANGEDSKPVSFVTADQLSKKVYFHAGYDHTPRVHTQSQTSTDVQHSNTPGQHQPYSNTPGQHQPYSNTPGQHHSNTPGQQQPHSNTPGQQQPHSNTPGQQQPHSNTPGQQQPHSNTPGQHQPHSNTPGQQQPHSNTPGQHQPHSNTPGQQQPHSNTPGQHQPHSNTPGQPHSNTPGQQQPHSNTPGQQQPHSNTPGQQQPHSNTPGQQQPHSNTPGQHQPHSNTPGQQLPHSNTPGQHHSNTPGQQQPHSNTPGQHQPHSNTPGQQQQTDNRLSSMTSSRHNRPVHPVHPVQPLKDLQTEPSPILRHKSLPSILDNDKLQEVKVRPDEVKSEEDLWLAKPPLSPRSGRHAISQGQLPGQVRSAQVVRTPPPSRRIILQHRQQRATPNMTGDRESRPYPSSPEMGPPSVRHDRPQPRTPQFHPGTSVSQWPEYSTQGPYSQQSGPTPTPGLTPTHNPYSHQSGLTPTHNPYRQQEPDVTQRQKTVHFLPDPPAQLPVNRAASKGQQLTNKARASDRYPLFYDDEDWEEEGEESLV
ncbi:F-BAR and double SH3 domains protein 2-like isoform X2 [Physella acuta]|uniref:F-BAR and double SH3 domains protein 2-like isoform X2 n=1 Tax=Physella acuta TaxID=109671 RepID=UPI0027DDFD49|nr:F-BAR and double SH3 domains protein 2-like isoform X2 [Physella acuta]